MFRTVRSRLVLAAVTLAVPLSLIVGSMTPASAAANRDPDNVGSNCRWCSAPIVANSKSLPIQPDDRTFQYPLLQEWVDQPDGRSILPYIQ